MKSEKEKRIMSRSRSTAKPAFHAPKQYALCAFARTKWVILRPIRFVASTPQNLTASLHLLRNGVVVQVVHFPGRGTVGRDCRCVVVNVVRLLLLVLGLR